MQPIDILWVGLGGGVGSVLFSVDFRDRHGSALNAGVLTGVLGGYTTFSSMQLDAAKLAGHSRQQVAFYLFISLVCGVLAAAAGAMLARLQG